MELRVTDLAVALAGVPVLEGVSFRLLPVRALVLRGPNGIGKTTLLRTLAGAENLGFWARAFGTRGVGAALAAMNLEALADRRAANLSAGQRRRLGLARLLVTGRPVWGMDEPTILVGG